MKSINEYILEEAQRWVGVKEIKNNELFDRKGFKKFLEGGSWDIGQAYCMYFAMQCWRIAYAKSGNSHILTDILDHHFSPSAKRSFDKFDSIDMVSGTPQIGSIAIWQLWKDGQPQWQGHAGIVENINFANNMIFTIEGNTGNPDQRTGDGVYRKDRSLLMTMKDDGLNLIGFIIPKQVEVL